MLYVLLLLMASCAAQQSQKPSISHDVDFVFFNDPYLFEQQYIQPEYDLTQAPAATFDVHEPIVDPTEMRDVDFSFFNDPYAFDEFREGLPVKATISGFLYTAAWWDTRIGDTLASGFLYLLPRIPEFDPDCRDINAQGTAGINTFETRLRTELFGPKVFGAESFGYIEADFLSFGQFATNPAIDTLVNRMRLRLALITMNWDHVTLLFGQFYHPFFVIKTFPLNISIERGAPIAPFARNPQVRYTYKRGRCEFAAAALAQLQFSSLGPRGQSFEYLVDSRLPMYMLRGAYNTEPVYAGAGLLFQRLKPRIESNTGFAVNESINSLQATAFATCKFDRFEIRQQVTYAQNANSMAMLGGFAVSQIEPITDKRTYTNLNTVSYWMDININRKIEPGIFVGIIKNLGASRDIIQCVPNLQTGDEEQTIYVFGENVDNLCEVTPRIRFHVVPMDFAFEIAHTRASFGCYDDRARARNTVTANNTRFIFAAYYYF